MALSAPSTFSSVSRSGRSSQFAPLKPMTLAMRRPVSGWVDWKAGDSAAAAASITRSATTIAAVRRPICLPPRFPLDCGLIMCQRRLLPSLCLLSLAEVAFLPLTGCKKATSEQISFQMGERVIAAPIVYNVVQTVWRTQLGDLFKVRVPDHRFLLITLSATNGGGKPVSVPFFTLEGS